MEVLTSSRIYQFFNACYEQGDILHSTVRNGSEAIWEVLRRTAEPSVDELFRFAFDEARRGDAAATSGAALTRLRDATRRLRETAASLANWDCPPTTYVVEWMQVMGPFNDAISDVSGFCPPAVESSAGQPKTSRRTKWTLVHELLDQDASGGENWDDATRRRFVTNYNRDYSKVKGYVTLTLELLSDRLRDRRKQSKKDAD